MGFDLGTEAAPGQLEHVRQFVNTLDVETGTDELDAPVKLASWLAERDLLDMRVEVGRGELRRAIELREALRRLLLANNAAALDGQAIETLNRIASGANLSVRFDPQGSPTLAVEGSGPDAAVAPIVAIVYDAMVNETWSRLKACRADDCHWAFYDHSRNRSGTWCDMAVCGNRAKARAYRDRRARGRRSSPNAEGASR
jgi:predicted RNA-binding Zn ribbon-like protein